MTVDAEFVASAAGPEGFPSDGAPEIALVGRSNVGKSSLINALVRQRLARTSAAPGKTRLVNLYRVRVRSTPVFYLVDLPGYGYARAPRRGSGRSERSSKDGRAAAARAFERLTAQYFDASAEHPCRPTLAGVLLLVDARHPGLTADLEACAWLVGLGCPVHIVVTKIDKLSKAERTRTMRVIESVFDAPAQPVSAVTGEGMDELWRQIIRHVSAGSRPGTPPSRASSSCRR